MERPRGSADFSSRPAADTKGVALLVVGSLIILVSAIYGQVRGHQFIDFDDSQYVSQNQHVLGGLTWSAITWAFTRAHAGYWIPLTWMSHMLDVQLFGRDAGAHLLVNAALHAVNSALLFLILRSMTGARWRSAAVAALFAVHPLHVESVAWISERKDTLSTFFFLLCILAYARYVLRNSRAAYWLSVIALALGLLAKPMLVTTPLVLLLLDLWPFDRFRRLSYSRLLVEKIPFALAAVGAVVAALLTQHEAMASTKTIAPLIRLAHIPIAYVGYLGKTFWPARLSIIYPFPATVSVRVAIVCAILIAAVTAAAIALRHSHPWLFVGWCWFIITLIPVIGIVQVGLQSIADRFTYIPHIGLFIAIMWTAAELVPDRPKSREVAASLCAAVVLVLAVIAHIQVGYWSGSIPLFEHALAVTSNENKLAHIELAEALLESGQYEPAERHFREAIGFHPFPDLVYSGLASALAGQGKLDLAAEAARHALQENAKNADAAAMLGSLELAQGNSTSAERALVRSLQLRRDPGVIARLALARGQLENARASFSEAVRLDPENADVRSDYAAVLARMQQDEAAEEEYGQALRLNPNLYDARMNYGALLSRTGRNSDAAEQFSEAARIRLHSAEPHVYLGLLYANEHRFDVAATEIQSAISIDHDGGNRMLINAIRIPPRPTAIDEYLVFLRQQTAGK